MRQLIIEYALEGRHRGYTYTSETRGFNDDTLKFVWRTCMPRGQGWGAAEFQQARSLKSFLLPDGRVALSDVVVTDARDESGRAGIRKASIDIMQPGEYAEALQGRFLAYPSSVQAEASRKPGFGRRRVPRVGDGQVICSHPYMQAQQWQLIEALILHTAITRMEGWLGGQLLCFTTLALDYRDESPLVVLPESRAQQLTDVRVHRLI
jgi:hypothetical protein